MRIRLAVLLARREHPIPDCESPLSAQVLLPYCQLVPDSASAEAGGPSLVELGFELPQRRNITHPQPSRTTSEAFQVASEKDVTT